MVGQKFFVYGGGRWREINLSTGRVAGWGLVEYLSVRRGRLELTRSNAVLRGLKALAAGKPTSVQDGPQLSQIRNIKTKNVQEPKPINNECQHHQHCCQHIIHSNTDANFNNILKPITSTIAVQCTMSNNYIMKKPNSTNNTNKSVKSNEKSVKRKRSSSESSDVFNTTDSQKTNSGKKLASSRAQRVKSSKTQEPCKELLISEEDILLIRTFVEHDGDNVLGVDLERFDSDDVYKCLVFYNLNPLVNVERSKEISELVKKKSVLTKSFKDFMKNLGLQSVEEASQVSSSKDRMRARRKLVKNTTHEKEFDKENIKEDVIGKETKRSSGVLGEKISQVVSRDVKTGKFLSTASLVKGNKSRPLSKKRNEITKNDLMIQNNLEKDKNAMITNKNEKTNKSPNKIEKMKENDLKKNNEQKNDSLRQNDSPKKRKEKNETELIKQKETEKHNTITHKKIKEKIVDQQKVCDNIISKELNNKESQNDSDSELSSDSDKQSDKRKKTKMPRLAVVTAKRGDSTRQPYTSAEDTVMVQWIRGQGRARQVNGNTLWRELQPIFHKKTGRFRSWHSLRNRYLRSLLPTLGNMAIPPDEATRLRAAAAAGELKSKKILKNSIYKEKRVLSAWSRRPRSPLRTSPIPFHSTGFLNSSSDRSRSSHVSDYTAESSESKEPRMYKKIGTKIYKSKRTLRSSAIGTFPKEKQKQTKPRTPTYSELTKMFALKHSTPDSDSAGYNNIDNNVRPTRLLRKNATGRQNAESSVDDITKDNNSQNNKHNIFKNNKKRKRIFSSDREDDDDRNDKNDVNSDQQKSKNYKYLNYTKKRARQISTDRQDTDTKSGRQNSKGIKDYNLSINRRNTRKSLIDRQDADSSNDQRNEKRLRNDEQNSQSIKNKYLNNKKIISNVSTDEDTDTSDNQTKTKKLTSRNNNINKRSKRNISSERQDTNIEDQVKAALSKRVWSTDPQNSKNNKTNLNNSKKRARKSSTEDEDIDTSDDEKQPKPINKTLNLNNSPNKSSNIRQNTNNDRINQKSKKIHNSDRRNDKNNLINKNNQNNSNKMSNGRHDSPDSSDFEQDTRYVKKLRSSKAKSDTGRFKPRLLFNPKDF